MRGLLLRLREVGGNSHNCFCDGTADVRLYDTFHFLEHHRRDLLRIEPGNTTFLSGPNLDALLIIRLKLERPVFAQLAQLRVTAGTANETLDIKSEVSPMIGGPIVCALTHCDFLLPFKCNNRWRRFTIPLIVDDLHSAIFCP
mmetsp:Transcript_46897/g.62064  ORF Transcript_46897/g.62064 Transcript_46897/m.62064 type:complete len:143 (+) Transcript_46897:1235-1663(+)